MKVTIKYDKQTKRWLLLEDGEVESDYPTRAKAIEARKKDIKFWQRSDEGEKLVIDLNNDVEKLVTMAIYYQDLATIFSNFEASDTTEKHLHECIKRKTYLSYHIHVALSALQQLPAWAKKRKARKQRK